MKCTYCNEKGETLDKIAKLDVMVFGNIPIKRIVDIWLNKGFSKETVLCPDCLIK